MSMSLMSLVTSFLKNCYQSVVPVIHHATSEITVRDHERWRLQNKPTTLCTAVLYNFFSYCCAEPRLHGVAADGTGLRIQLVRRRIGVPAAQRCGGGTVAHGGSHPPGQTHRQSAHIHEKDQIQLRKRANGHCKRFELLVMYYRAE